MEKYVKVYGERQDAQAMEMDANNYNLGKYIALAFHDPKHYPKKPFLYKETKKETKVMTVDEMEAMMKRNTIILGGKIN